MADDTTPSSGAGATPATGSPSAGTPSGGATPPKSAATLEEALARIAELERHATNKAEEAARHGTKLTAAEKELAAYKEKERLAQEASMTEQQKLQAAMAEKEQLAEQLAIELFERYVHDDVANMAPKLNFLEGIPPKYLARLIDWDAIEEEGGKPSNVQTLLEQVAKDVPMFIKQAQTPNQQQQRQAPTVPAMNPGRSTIAQPGASIPGRIPRLDDIQWKRG